METTPTNGELVPKRRVAYSYYRFSSKAQEQGASLARQTELAEKYVKEHDLILDDTLRLRDLGVSAYKSKNATTGALSEFLGAINVGRVAPGSLLLIENLDRLSRAELNISVALVLQIINAGVDIVTLMDGRLYTSEGLEQTNLILGIIFLSRGHDESRTKSVRVKDAYQRRIQKARDLAGKYRITRIGPAWLKPNDSGGWEIIAEHAEIVREIFQMYDQGYGKWRIAQALNRRGLRSFRGKDWSARYVAHLLTNPAAIGVFRPGHWIGGTHRYHKDQDIPNYFPAVVSQELFWRCYHRIQSKYNPPKPRDRVHLLAGITHCGHFNERAVVWGTTKTETRANGTPKKYRYFYFVAASVPTDRSQEYKSWNIEWLERNFLLACIRIDWQQLAQERNDKPKPDWAARRAQLESRARELKTEISNLYGYAARGDLEGVGDQIAKREREQREIKDAINEVLADEESTKQCEASLTQSLGENLMRQVLEDGGKQDIRCRLKEEIRRRVKRIDIYSMGFDLGAMVERDTGVPMRYGKVRCYKVTFANEAVRWIVPAGKKDTDIAYVYNETTGEETTCEDQVLPPEFQLPPEEPGAKRGRKKQQPWRGLGPSNPDSPKAKESDQSRTTQEHL